MHLFVIHATYIKFGENVVINRSNKCKLLYRKTRSELLHKYYSSYFSNTAGTPTVWMPFRPF